MKTVNETPDALIAGRITNVCTERHLGEDPQIIGQSILLKHSVGVWKKEMYVLWERLVIFI